MAPEQVKITVTENGPYSVMGPFTLVDQDGNTYDVAERRRVALCRCGASSTKPFCDGTHSRIGFEAAERATRDFDVGGAQSAG
ncbi:CDGSH iron-sulfur domain-containing protein [Thermoleophilia bacterium SCSIO 60948]|nr:CDGSH iron-sulfur domain-containing protein [Thermoleophilia bacterium SCSIO 60948]